MTIKPPTKVVELGSFANTRYEDNEIVKICVYTNGARIEASAKRCARVASIWPAPPKTPINVRMNATKGSDGITQFVTTKGASDAAAMPFAQSWLVAVSSTPANNRVMMK